MSHLYCNSSLSDDDFAIKSKHHNSILSCFNLYPGFQDANLPIIFYSIQALPVAENFSGLLDKIWFSKLVLLLILLDICAIVRRNYYCWYTMELAFLSHQCKLEQKRSWIHACTLHGIL